MEDVTLFQFSWKRPARNQQETSYRTAQTQTAETSQRDAECTANFQNNKEVQTNEIERGVAEKQNVRISKEVVEILDEFIHDNSKVNYDRLLEFHKFDKVALETVQKFHVEVWVARIDN